MRGDDLCVLSCAQKGPPLGGISPRELMPWEGCVNKLPLFAAGTLAIRVQIKIS